MEVEGFESAGEAGKASIEVRPAQVEDVPALLRLFASGYGELSSFKGAERLKWQTANPYWESELPPFWVAVDRRTGEIVGKIGVQAGELCFNEKSWPAWWIVDVFVRDDCRGLGIAGKISASLAQHFETLVTLTMAPATRRIAERQGAITTPPVWQLAKPIGLSRESVRRLGNYYLRRRGLLGQMAAVGLQLGGDSAFRLLAAGRSGFVRRRASMKKGADVGRWESRQLSETYQELDRYRACSGRFGFVRSKRWLAWRLRDVPDLDYEMCRLEAAVEPSPSVVMRHARADELPFLRVLDVFLGESSEHSYYDVYSCLDSLARSSTEWIEMAVSSSSELAAAKRAGFMVTRVHRPTLVTRNAELGRLARSHEWHLSRLDHDWDQIYPSSYFA